MKKTFVTTILSATILSGCVSMYDFSSIPGTSFITPPMSASDMPKFKQDIAKLNKQVLSDELGSYYWELNGDKGYYYIVMKQEDLSSLKYLFSKSVGLMEPMYTYDNNADLILDKKATKKRYNYLKNKVGIKLRPFSETLKYHAYLKGRAKAEFNKVVADGFYAGGQVFNGNYGIYNTDYYPTLTSFVGKDFSYIVKNSVANSYYNQISMQLSKSYGAAQARETKNNSSDPRAKYIAVPGGNDSSSNKALKYKVAASSLNNSARNNISFVPMDFYKNVKTGGLYTMQTESSCGYGDLDSMKLQFEISGSSSVFSAVMNNIKKEDKDDIAKEKAKFLTEMSKGNTKRALIEKGCLVGLNALDVSGVIESKKLR